ncbi:HotDog domain-containing protein [Penicillium manginii]|jgi:acyl-coenzyme A thioesterase PaaI-like protein|uniref:HotDog domain-containing protein n=1 Tax=Penicillium manginii TaxID=203109 RepID=UPI002548C124|nr:HotDog domain-containing protein [Penicillium manginii]KAJ5744571.1 HotDog domain-containing protein [Penicillium manginii]
MDIDDASRYHSIPWVSKLLQDTAFVTVPSTNRDTKSSTEDSLFSVTLKSNATLSGFLSQYRRPTLTSGSGETGSIDEVRMIFILGSNLNGYPGVLHGGIVTTLLDECTGLLLVLRSKYKAGDDDALEPGSKTVTAYLNTNFLRPVPTPGAIVVYAKLEETKENRKWKIKGRVCDEDDQILATAECLYVKSRSKI